MTQLPLHSIHKEKGARFAAFGDWELPEHYGNPQREYLAVRENVGLADLSHQGTFLLRGDDRHVFLQNLMSNDLELLTENRGISTCLLTAKGKVISNFDLFSLAEGLASEALLIDVESNNAENTKAQLMRYRLRSKVEILSPDWGRLLVSGPKAATLLELYFDGPLPALQEKSFFQKKIGNISVLCIKRSITGEEDYQLYAGADVFKTLWDSLSEVGQALNLSLVGQTAQEILRIEAGLPRYGIDIDDEILPIEAGLEAETISYTKGCYPGQEVMARIQTYGHANKGLTGLLLDGDVLPYKGDPVYQDKKAVGVVRSAVKSPHLERMIALAYLRTSAASPGTALEVEIAGNRTSAEVVALPFYKQHDARV